jgi:hypothetical protein
MFKANAAPKGDKFLCCDEAGNLEWIDGNVQVIKINGVAGTLITCQKLLKKFI